MKDPYIEACMNPIRQRILQVILEEKEVSTSQILEILSDVPRASLYRHIKTLLDAEAIQVVKEVPKRGSIEKVYSIVIPSHLDHSNSSFYKMIQTVLLMISADFSKYLKNEDNNPEKDMLTVGSATILATDDEFAEFINEYSSLLHRFMQNTPTNDRKERKVTFISSPTF